MPALHPGGGAYGQGFGATITTSRGSGTTDDNDTKPVANADTASLDRSGYQTVDLVANDSDPRNNVPLHLVSITGRPWVGHG